MRGTQLDLLAGRPAARLAGAAGEVAGLLSDDTNGVLGRRRLLWPFRDFVQWNPADDAIVRLRVSTEEAAGWQLSTRLSELELQPDGGS